VEEYEKNELGALKTWLDRTEIHLGGIVNNVEEYAPNVRLCITSSPNIVNCLLSSGK
jgi:hypothetical protein